MSVNFFFWSIKISTQIIVPLNNGNGTVNGSTNFSDATIIGVIDVDELLLVPKLISVYQLFSVAPVLICEIAVITVFTVKTFEKTRIPGLFSPLNSLHWWSKENSLLCNRILPQHWRIESSARDCFAYQLFFRKFSRHDHQEMTYSYPFGHRKIHYATGFVFITGFQFKQ